MGNNSLVKENETMRVEYQKTQLFYGDYRPGHVIWITLLNGLKVLKFNLLDQAGNILYSLELKYDEDEEEIIYNRITYGAITNEQIKDIQEILMRNDPYYDWCDDGKEDNLKCFACEIMLIADSKKHSLKTGDLLVIYDIYSSYEENEGKEVSNKECYEAGTITRAEIESDLVHRLLEHKEWDTIEMKIFENGQMYSYLLEFEDRDE